AALCHVDVEETSDDVGCRGRRRSAAAQKQAKNRKKALMDLPLRTISYIADIGNMVVLMARGKMVRSHSAQENLDQTSEQTDMNHDDRRMYRMICHVFESEDDS
ncbi:Amyloid-beta A4 precursor protein-binding A member 1, partial [Xenoophorus captivus]